MKKLYIYIAVYIYIKLYVYLFWLVNHDINLFLKKSLLYILTGATAP